MSQTQPGATESIGPFLPETVPGPDDPSRFSEVVVKLIGLVDEFERLFGDPPKAWAALRAEIQAREARWAARKPAAPGPSPAGPGRRERRPFVGFDREMATYERLKPEWLAKAEGKWIVIVGEEVIGPFDDISQAMDAGFVRFGLGPLFIKQVLAQEPTIILPPYLDLSCPT